MAKDLSSMNQAEIIQPILISDQIIEPIVNTEFSKIIEQEAFMNEIVEVTIADNTDESAPPMITMNVNGINQPFFRGHAVNCRRMFLEVLARCKESKYTQHRDPMQPDRMEMRERTALAYPFTVIDKNPRGSAWLKAVMAEAN